LRQRAITVKDVAQEAGVSAGTVSKALSGQGQLRADTRDRVIAAARRLGYQPNHFAQSLLSGRSYVIGVLTTDSIGRFTIPILTGAEDVLGAGQMSMMLCESRGDPVRERHYLRTLLSQRVDGIIVTGRSSDERSSLGGDVPIPVVSGLCRSSDPSDVSVTHDDGEGAALAIRHLAETGRRRIAVIPGPPGHIATENRSAGAAAELLRLGLEPVPVSAHGQWSEEWGREAAAILHRRGDAFDGAFCMSDQIARGFTDGLREIGVRVPEEVGVVGMDNWDAMVNSARPPITTIDLELSKIGHLAASLLLEMIAGKPVPAGVRLVPASLVYRRSSAVMPA
jgi:LacI family transcriptional regulator